MVPFHEDKTISDTNPVAVPADNNTEGKAGLLHCNTVILGLKHGMPGGANRGSVMAKPNQNIPNAIV